MFAGMLMKSHGSVIMLECSLFVTGNSASLVSTEDYSLGVSFSHRDSQNRSSFQNEFQRTKLSDSTPENQHPANSTNYI